MAKKLSKTNIIVSKLEEKNLNETQVKFIVSLYRMICRNSDPASHHIFCDKIAEKVGVDKEGIQQLVQFFSGWPYRFTATNGRGDCTDFRCTDYFVDWLHDIGVR